MLVPQFILEDQDWNELTKIANHKLQDKVKGEYYLDVDDDKFHKFVDEAMTRLKIDEADTSSFVIRASAAVFTMANRASSIEAKLSLISALAALCAVNPAYAGRLSSYIRT